MLLWNVLGFFFKWRNLLQSSIKTKAAAGVWVYFGGRHGEAVNPDEKWLHCLLWIYSSSSSSGSVVHTIVEWLAFIWPDACSSALGNQLWHCAETWETFFFCDSKETQPVWSGGSKRSQIQGQTLKWKHLNQFLLIWQNENMLQSSSSRQECLCQLDVALF